MSKHNWREQLYSKLCADHHDDQINYYRERLKKLLDVNWLEPEKILVSSARGRRANANQLSKKDQSIKFNRGKIIELDNQRFVLMIEIIQGKENWPNDCNCIKSNVSAIYGLNNVHSLSERKSF